MQNLRTLSVLILLLMATIGLRAQNGNAVVSEVKVYDLGTGAGIIEVRVSGNLASTLENGTFVISGDRIPGGTTMGSISESSRIIIPEQPHGNANINGNVEVIFKGLFALNQCTSNVPVALSTEVFVLRRTKKGTNMLLPSICQ